MRALVTGVSGFIGSHLARFLIARGYDVIGVDNKLPEFDPELQRILPEFHLIDLRDDCCETIAGSNLRGDVDEVYHLAANMGGIGYITKDKAQIAVDNATIDMNVITAARHAAVPRFFFSSSACIYPTHLQEDPNVAALKENDAFPARPEEGYGLEKLFMERVCEYHAQDFGMQTRVARFHNVYGDRGTFQGGAEKAPAALCRKVAMAPNGGEIDIWGDGQQTRSFLHVDDCCEGIWRLMHLDAATYTGPLNIGSDRSISIDDLADLIIKISGKQIGIKHVPGPQGVRGRNSDNTQAKRLLNWSPPIALEDGLARPYAWIAAQVAR